MLATNVYTTAELRARVVATLNRFKPPDSSKAALLLWFTISVFECLCNVCLCEHFILDSRLAIFGKEMSFWHSVCNVLIVFPLL